MGHNRGCLGVYLSGAEQHHCQQHRKKPNKSSAHKASSSLSLSALITTAKFSPDSRLACYKRPMMKAFSMILPVAALACAGLSAQTPAARTGLLPERNLTAANYPEIK